MFTPEDRERIRTDLLTAARSDARISGGATDIARVLEGWTARMYRDHDCVHHVDVVAGAWIYRVFLLRSTLQVDLAFAPAAEFGARAATFRLVFGQAADIPHVSVPKNVELVGLAWLYGLHVRSSIKRGRLWQAEYMLSAMRDQLRHAAGHVRGERGGQRRREPQLAPLVGAGAIG